MRSTARPPIVELDDVAKAEIVRAITLIADEDLLEAAEALGASSAQKSHLSERTSGCCGYLVASNPANFSSR